MPSCVRTRLYGLAIASVVQLCAAGVAHAVEPARAGTLANSCVSLEVQLVQEPDPALRVELADCYSQLARTASAWAQYREAASAAREAGLPELEATARLRAKALESELSYVTVHTWKGQPVMVTQDGAPVDETVLGTAMPLDPGPHSISASAPGKRGWSKRIVLGGRSDHVEVSVPVLPDDMTAAGPDLTLVPPPPPESALTPAIDSIQRTLGLVAGALGIAGVATGTLFGLKAASDWSDTKEQCRAFPYCGEDGARLANQAKTSALISTIGFATGIAGLSGGALLWFTAPAQEKQTPTRVGVGVGNVTVRGSL